MEAIEKTEIIEQSITPKSPTAEAEDGIAVSAGFIAVIDGSTSKTPVRVNPGMSNGRFCMLLICDYIMQADPAATVTEFCRGLTACVRQQYHGLDMTRLEAHPEERLTASCIVCSLHHRQIWMIGDCQCLVDGTLYENPKPYEAPIAEKRAAIAHRLLDSGEATVNSLLTDDIARKAIFPDMLETMRNQNRTYAVVDGFDIPMDKVRVINLDAARPHSIVLATDGYPFLCPTLTESEAALTRQRETDPLNITTFKATKAFARGNNSFDDRTYIRFRMLPL